jgi:hypothetical protein
MLYNVFDTEAEAQVAQAYDFKKFMEIFSDNNGYDRSTSCWAVPTQRITDKKWIYKVCPQSDAEYTTEEYQIET